MSQCPVCHQQIEITEQHHGTLMTCSYCKAVFFVGWDGQPEITPLDQSPAPPGYEAVAPEQTPQAFGSQPTPTTFDSPPGVPLDGIGGVNTPHQDPSWAPMDSVPISLEQPNETISPSFAEPVVAETKSSLFADVVDFGNSIQNQGLLSYDLLIQGIDLDNHRQILRDCLTDVRFRWNVDELMDKIQDGKLRLSPLSAAKMMVLTRRLKAYPFQISWRQSALTV